MAYFLPYIDAAGMHIPLYTDIRDILLEEARGIFGADTYLEIDSADYQYISVISLKMFESLQAMQLAYNNRSPQTAIGAGLDGIVMLNGLTRIPATYSTCQVVLSGAEGTEISGGEIRDNSNNLWSLPASVTIPSLGSVEVTATCQVLGPIEAAVGDLSQIVTPTSGWLSVTNNVIAVPGASVESDTALRSRQALSVAFPSQTLLEGTVAKILAVENVARAAVYENDTSLVTEEGFPAHSITCVVEGGADADIANAIHYNKGVGGYTNGTTLVSITDTYGNPVNIRFYRPSYSDVYVTVNLKKLSGWSPAMATSIKNSVADYINSLRIGEDIIVSSIWGTILQEVLPDLRIPAFSITEVYVGRTPETKTVDNLSVSFYEITQCEAADVVVEAN